MFNLGTIAQHVRVVLLAFTLLCVVGLNNREVTTFVTPPPETHPKHQVIQGIEEPQTIVKQKVSFEGTTSCVLLQLAACTEFLNVLFTQPSLYKIAVKQVTGEIIPFFSRFLSSVIQPNAPWVSIYYFRIAVPAVCYEGQLSIYKPFFLSLLAFFNS